MTAESVKFGTVEIPAMRVITEMRQQDAPPIRQGAGGRADRQGVRQFLISSLEGGLGVIRGRETTQDTLRFQRSDGLVSHIPNGLYLPYRLQSQTFTGHDSSGDTAANRRVHVLNSSLGQSKLRFHAFRGKKHYRNVSDSDHSLEDSGLVLTDNVTAAAESKLNNTRYIWLATDGTTDDISGIADPTASPPTLTTLVALSAGDWVGAIIPLPTLGPGVTVLYGKIGGTTGLFWLRFDDALLTTPKPVVLAETKDQENPSATIFNTGPVYPGNAVSARIPDLLGSPSGNWANPTNVLADDGNNATFTSNAGASANSIMLWTSDYDFGLPASGITITGILAEIERLEAAADDDITDLAVCLGRNITLSVATPNDEYNLTVLGINKADRTTEWPTSAAVAQYGGSEDRWGADLTLAVLRSSDFGLGLTVRMVGTSEARVDFMRLTAYYRFNGIQASIPLGGNFECWDPVEPHTCYITAPEFQDETTSVSVPRILWKLAFAWDAPSERPVVTLTKVRTGLAHVQQAVQALGNIVVSGDSVAGKAKSAKLIRRDDIIVDLGINSTGQGLTEDWGIVNMWSADRLLIFDLVKADNSVVQTMCFFDNKISALTERETITAAPLFFAGVGLALDPGLRRRYRFIPSGSDTVVTRSFQPRNLLEDPLRNNTSEIKANGPLPIILPELDTFGPEESAKCALTAYCLSRDVSATKTIRLRYSTDGGTTFTTWATFTSFMAKATLPTPVALETLVLEIALDHTVDTADTPNGLPILLEGISRWGPLRRWRVIIDPGSPAFKRQFTNGGMHELWDELAALVETNPVQTFAFGGRNRLATWEDFRTFDKPALEGAAKLPIPIALPGQEHEIVFDEVPQ